MKETILRFGSYVLVAVLATMATLTMVHLEVGLKPTKLEQLEALIEEKFIGEADAVMLEDAAADAMVKATGDRWSYYMSAEEYETYGNSRRTPMWAWASPSRLQMTAAVF